MTAKQQISEVAGVADPKSARLFREIKTIIDRLTGNSKGEIKKLGVDATTAGQTSKINEIIDRLNGR